MRYFLFALLFLPLVATAQIEDADLIFRELYGVDGTWFMPTDRGDRLEIWKVVDDSTITGKAVRIKIESGDTALLETLRLELRGQVITYYAAVRNQNGGKAIPFELTQADDEGYLFENPDHGDPNKIRYRLLGNREMQVTAEGMRNGRPVTQEYVFEREFTASAIEFRVRIGANYHSLRSTGNFRTVDPIQFQAKPGWEIGTTAAFKGRGGFITLNFDLSLAGKFAAAKSEFQGDTVYYVRDVTYNNTWLVLGVTPEITFRRDGRFSVFAGPYIARLLVSRAKGTQTPSGDNKLFDANNDFNKTDFGLVAGLQYKLNFGKKDLGGIIGVRGNLGLRNLDNLYDRGCINTNFCNGQIFLSGATVYYSVNLLKI